MFPHPASLMLMRGGRGRLYWPVPVSFDPALLLRCRGLGSFWFFGSNAGCRSVLYLGWYRKRVDVSFLRHQISFGFELKGRIECLLTYDGREMGVLFILGYNIGMFQYFFFICCFIVFVGWLKWSIVILFS